MDSMVAQSFDASNVAIQQQSYWIARSYTQILGQPLLAIPVEQPSQTLALALYQAPFAILSHDIVETIHGRDNMYNYANQAALQLFQRSWAEQLSLPSSKSAESSSQPQQTRNNWLARCLVQGHVQFDCERVTGNGGKVALRNIVLFNVFDDAGIYRGQAVRIDPQQATYV